MASVAALRGSIQDALTIHVSSAGVPVAVSYEVRDDATCLDEEHMGYFRGVIPFTTNVTIVAPSPAVKFAASIAFQSQKPKLQLLKQHHQTGFRQRSSLR